jgi:hypothetical protein
VQEAYKERLKKILLEAIVIRSLMDTGFGTLEPVCRSLIHHQLQTNAKVNQTTILIQTTILRKLLVKRETRYMVR